MRALALDYVRVGRRTLVARAVLMAIAVAFVSDTGYRYFALKAAIERNVATMARGKSMESPPLPSIAPSSHSAEEYSLARQTLGRLATPWDQLFDALEAAHSEPIVLLGIEPDAENRTVTLTGEAKDYLAVLSYLANLEQQDLLRRVHLVHHEVRRQISARPLLFTISATWKERG